MICIKITVISQTKKPSVVELKVKSVMSAYLEYRDSILNANAAFEDYGYIYISSKKEALERCLRALFVDLY